MDIGIGLGDEAGPSGIRDQKVEEEYHFEVLSTEQIVQHMVESIKEVNSVIQVSSGGTMVRIVASFLRSWVQSQPPESLMFDFNDKAVM